MQVLLQNGQVMFVYQGHRVKVKVTAKNLSVFPVRAPLSNALTWNVYYWYAAIRMSRSSSYSKVKVTTAKGMLCLSCSQMVCLWLKGNLVCQLFSFCNRYRCLIVAVVTFVNCSSICRFLNVPVFSLIALVFVLFVFFKISILFRVYSKSCDSVPLTLHGAFVFCSWLAQCAVVMSGYVSYLDTSCR